MSSSGLYSLSLTPTTNMGASLLGAEIITFFAPPFK
uniref:Glyceraldehyde-3-phosphate dehydrogenase n=1 Tax=Rhizophora mucronata TaxID=61149 RepID=A0A2P2JDV1_RHIMU